MKSFLYMLKKEVRLMRSAFLYFWLFFLLIMAVTFVYDLPGNERFNLIRRMIIPWGFFSHAVILWYSMRNDWNMKCFYQSYSLPMQRFPQVLARFLTVMAMAAIYLAVVAIGLKIAAGFKQESFRQMLESNVPRGVPNPFLGFGMWEPVYAFLFTFLLMSFVNFAEIIRYSVRRGRNFIAGFSLIALLIGNSVLTVYLMVHDIWPGFREYCLILGLLVTAISCFIYEKFGEV